LTLHRNYNLACSCKYWWEALEFPGLARGTQWLAKIRVGGFWLAAPALSRIGTLESHWESHCPCCGDETPETLTYLGLQCPRWKQERSELLEGQQQLDITVIVEGRTLTLNVAPATDGPLTEPQRSLVANKLTLYLLGGRSSVSDAQTGPVRSLRLITGGCQAQTRIANRQQRIPCMITKERGGSQDVSEQPSFSSVSGSEDRPASADSPSTNRRRDPILRRVNHASSRRPLWHGNAVLAR